MAKAVCAKEVGWAHAANDEAHLRAALADDLISMVEADIMLRTSASPPATAAGVPVMAHPPSIPPDAMPFEAWFDLILEHNQQAATNGKTQKGVKLDFKSQQAVAPCLAILLARRAFDFPVWLNADVLPGPGRRTRPAHARVWVRSTNRKRRLYDDQAARRLRLMVRHSSRSASGRCPTPCYRSAGRRAIRPTSATWRATRPT
jgi:hypothetical protein